MSERLETLKKARERMAERARMKFVETQVLIDAIDRAIDGEQAGPAAAA
jgi:hypothetical protein